MPEAPAQGRGKKSAGSVAASATLVATSLLSQAGARPSWNAEAEANEETSSRTKPHGGAGASRNARIRMTTEPGSQGGPKALQP